MHQGNAEQTISWKVSQLCNEFRWNSTLFPDTSCIELVAPTLQMSSLTYFIFFSFVAGSRFKAVLYWFIRTEIGMEFPWILWVVFQFLVATSWSGQQKGDFFRFFFSRGFSSPKHAVYMGRKRIFRSIAWLKDQNEKKALKKVRAQKRNEVFSFSSVAFESKRFCNWSSRQSIAAAICYPYLYWSSAISLWFLEKVTKSAWVCGRIKCRLPWPYLLPHYVSWWNNGTLN